MRKRDMLSKQEYIWLRNMLDKEIDYVKKEFTESNEHPLWELRLRNLEGMRVKLTNLIKYQPKKRIKTNNGDMK